MSVPPNPYRQEYLEHIEKQKNSGLSIKKYCVDHNLLAHKFSYYRTYKLKLKEQATRSTGFATVKLNSISKNIQAVSAVSNKPKVDPLWLAQLIKSLLELK